MNECMKRRWSDEELCTAYLYNIRTLEIVAQESANSWREAEEALKDYCPVGYAITRESLHLKKPD